MMKIIKLQTDISLPPLEEFQMQENKVQGAYIGKKGDDLLIISPRRYKLFTTGTDFVKILEGAGFFKWKRGETKFCAGDCFEISEVGEYELNGNGKYIVLKNQNFEKTCQ